MFLDPDKLAGAAPAEVLDAASRGHLGLDHRFLHALLDRRDEALPALLELSKRDRGAATVDLTPELIAFFRHWHTPESLDFLIGVIGNDPEEVPDEAVEALVAIGQPAVEPLLALYGELDESDSGEIAFVLANLKAKDERILNVLLDRLEFDLADTALLLGIYGDPAALPSLETAAAELNVNLADGNPEVVKEIAEAIETLKNPPVADPEEKDTFDIWSLYPETADIPLDLLDEDERTALLEHPVASVRAAAAGSFFNRELTALERTRLLEMAQRDSDAAARARAWEALMGSTEEPEVVEAMLTALRNPALSVEERGGLAVGLAPEADRNEVRKAIAALYEIPEGRAKALEAMWRSVHPAFRDNFAKHLDDRDLEVRRGAIWGVGYFGLKSELDRIRKFFEDEELRADALFAYALAVPAELSRGRMKGLLARIEKDANGLSSMEEELVKSALDERLMLAGKDPVFLQQED